MDVCVCNIVKRLINAKIIRTLYVSGEEKKMMSIEVIGWFFST